MIHVGWNSQNAPLGAETTRREPLSFKSSLTVCMMIRVILLAALILPVGAAQERPRINVGGVVPNQPGNLRSLKPGIEVSIYGQHLGPTIGCTAGAGGWSDVKQLCGTAVTVGGVPAVLLYVQDKQINLRVPFNVPTEGLVPFVVTRDGRISPAVPARFEPYLATIKPSGMPYVDMPVWIEIQLPSPLWRSLRYPVTIRPADFGGHQFEVRRDGILLPPKAARYALPVVLGGPGTYGTVGSGSLVGLPHEPKNPRQLPLHLMYRFDRPGRYEVRYIGYDFRYPMQKHALARSPWIPIQVRPLAPGKRQAWLESMRSAEPGDPVEWLSDYLPSLLAVPDAAVLPLLKNAVYHPNDLVRQYVLYALSFFDDSLLISWIPATIQSSGPTPDLAYLLSWRRDLFQSRGSEIVHAVLPHLKSTSPLLAAGALQTLYFLKPQYDWKTHPEIPGLLDRAVASQAERLIGMHSAVVLQPLALYLGTWKTETSRRLLRHLVAEGTVREQAEICLQWISNAAGR